MPVEETETNQIEIRFYGLMRSGNHAIINWVQEQYQGLFTCFLNNVKHEGADPYLENTDVLVKGVESSTDIEELRNQKDKILMYSYEDRFGLEINDNDFLGSVCPEAFEENREKYLGASTHQFDVMILRDPFNCLASRYRMIQSRGPQGGQTDMMKIASDWKCLAREAVSINSAPNSSKLVASYNKWVTDKAYRMELSQKLRGTFNDSSVDKVAGFGGGSSFPETTVAKLTFEDILRKWRKAFSLRRLRKFGTYIQRLFAKKPVSDDFFERWKAVADDENYRELFRDPEMLELSEKLFGELPGTRDFVKSL